MAPLLQWPFSGDRPGSQALAKDLEKALPGGYVRQDSPTCRFIARLLALNGDFFQRHPTLAGCGALRSPPYPAVGFGFFGKPLRAVCAWGGLSVCAPAMPKRPPSSKKILGHPGIVFTDPVRSSSTIATRPGHSYRREIGTNAKSCLPGFPHALERRRSRTSRSLSKLRRNTPCLQ